MVATPVPVPRIDTNDMVVVEYLVWMQHNILIQMDGSNIVEYFVTAIEDIKTVKLCKYHKRTT